MPLVVVGCCGFPVSRSRYFSRLRAVELQNTFYNNPSVEEAVRLRSSLPDGAIVTIKAWQALTHSPRSPTWRRMKRQFPKKVLNGIGMLRPTDENRGLWREVREVAKALRAEFIVFQTPPSFGYSQEHYENALRFFCEIVSDSPAPIGWEPRGTWHENPKAIKDIAERCRVIHVVDILRREPVMFDGQDIAYIRLHGLGGRGEVNYRYKYTDSDLETLASKVRRLIDAGVGKVYVFFNNIYMFDDALRFKEVISKVCNEIGCEVV